MRVLGVDPGLTRCGLAVVDRVGGKLSMVDVGVIYTDKNANLENRLLELDNQENNMEQEIFKLAPPTKLRSEIFTESLAKIRKDINTYSDYTNDYSKITELNKKIRINKAGCLDRCDLGPVLVIYPEGVWYTFKNLEDIDEILNSHLLNDKIVERLRI